MKCPNCNYEPVVNEYDYAEAPSRFYELRIEAKQVGNDRWPVHEINRGGSLWLPTMRCDVYG